MDVARVLLDKGTWSWACFMAEEAVHAALRHLFALRDCYPHMRIGHMKLELLAASLRFLFPSWRWSEDSEMQEMFHAAITLGPYYTDTRYPSPEGSHPMPYEAFTEEQATWAVAVASRALRAISERQVALAMSA